MNAVSLVVLLQASGKYRREWVRVDRNVIIIRASPIQRPMCNGVYPYRLKPGTYTEIYRTKSSGLGNVLDFFTQ